MSCEPGCGRPDGGVVGVRLSERDRERALSHLYAKAVESLWSRYAKPRGFTRDHAGAAAEAIRWVLADALDHKRLGLARASCDAFCSCSTSSAPRWKEERR